MTRSKMSAMETAVRIAPTRAIPVPDKGVARWPGRRGCVTGLHKRLLPAVFLLLPSFALAQPDFNSVDFRRGALSAAAADFSIPVPQALSAEEAPGFRPAPPAPEILRHDDGLINTLSPQEWARLLAGPRETEFPDLNTVTKELYSGFHIRYIAWGSLDLRATPPTFTTKAGKVFVVAKYPEWLKEAGRSCLCIEGYAKQQDDTSELAITAVLPADADDYFPAESVQTMQKHPYIAAKNSAAYTLGHVRWGIEHAADGTPLTGPDGHFKYLWPAKVVLKPELFEGAYFGKKTMPGFPYLGTHGFLMFKFKPGGVTDGGGNSAAGVVVSLNGYFKSPAELGYSTLDGLRGKYMVYYNISTVECYAEQNLFTDSNPLAFYPLTIPRRLQLKLLDRALTQASDNRMGEMYSLFYNSCTNAVVSIINGVLDEKRKLRAGWLPEIIYRLRATIPDAASALLRKKGIIGPPALTLNGTNYKQAFTILQSHGETAGATR